MFKIMDMEDKGDIHSEQEREHFYKIIHSFKAYRVFNRAVIYKRLRYLSTLPERQQQLLVKYKRRLEKAAVCIDHNDTIIKLIIQDVEQMFENVNHKPVAGQKRNVTNQDIEKVNITIKQIYRDWTEEGSIEREKCYKPIIEEIEKHFPENECNRGDIKVLIPGAGLGRLAFEVAKRGFTCQGNEFSFYMLMASNFILNNCLGAGGHELYPWVHQLDNILNSEDQFKKVRFPDCDPSDLYSLHGTSRFSMTAGDFTEVYTEVNDWDCVATCFFIDCANNIVQYIEQIYNMLKPGGLWTSFGPLQYHFSSSVEEESIEPSFEEIKEIIRGIGFIIQKEETGIETSYSQHQESMLKNIYVCAFLVCVKPHS